MENPGFVFISTGDAIGHVGLFYNEVIYESYWAYTDDPYTNLFTGEDTFIADDLGVQKSHTLGTFLGLAVDTNSNTLPWQGTEIVPIPEQEAATLATWIETQLDKGYIPTFSQNDFASSLQQKGISDNRYSGVGLLERATEQTGFNGGQGYIPNSLEFVTANISSSNEPVVVCQAIGCSQPEQIQLISVLSPALLYQGISTHIDTSNSQNSDPYSPVEDIPEPSVLLGLIAVGGLRFIGHFLRPSACNLSHFKF